MMVEYKLREHKSVKEPNDNIWSEVYPGKVDQIKFSKFDTFEQLVDYLAVNLKDSIQRQKNSLYINDKYYVARSNLVAVELEKSLNKYVNN